MNKQGIKGFAASIKKLLINNIKLSGANECYVNEIAYIWFSRIIAVHYLNVNKYLPSSNHSFIEQCQMLNRFLPEIFNVIPDYAQNINLSYTEIEPLINKIENQDFKSPEIIGWLYQYYNSEQKDEAFALLQNNIKISKEHIPVATQIFTPEWIVKYLVENSLGTLFGKKSSKWEYYIDNKSKPANDIDVTKLTLIDPCMGCGNILLYAFDVFMDIYKAYGYDESKAAISILENNIYGVDIDDKAYQLAYFALLMKARSYNDDIFRLNLTLNLCAIKEDSALFSNAKEYGSLIKINDVPKGYPLIKQAEIISRKYDVVVTNPPYMGRKSLNPTLSKFIDTHYPDGKSELYSAFIIACIEMLKDGGICAMVTIHTWMFISSFANLRKYVLNSTTISSMVHTGAATFEGLNSFNALATAFCLKKGEHSEFPSVFIRLADYYSTREKLKNFNNADNRYVVSQATFESIPQCPFIYWISSNIRRAFEESKPLKFYCSPKQGLATGENKRFLKYWYEVPRCEIGFGCTDIAHFHKINKKYAPYNKGGDYRKWYGNNEFVIKFDKENYDILSKQGNNLPSKQFYFKEGITWSLFGFENFSVRYKPCGFVFDVSGSSMFPTENAKYILAFLSSKVAFLYLSIIAPTVNFQVGNIASLPLIIDDTKMKQIEKLVDENIAISKADWDSFETSWDFTIHPLISADMPISESFEMWKAAAQSRYDKLKSNEEQLNNIFIEIYCLQGELSATVADRDIAIRTANLERDIKSLISYSVGCMFGRFGNGNFDIIPLTDDIVREFVNFIKDNFGMKNLEQNIAFIASVLGNKGGTPEDVIKNYFVKNFYKDHFKTYKKHPIYHECETNGVKSLMYIHTNFNN